jgi:hypothetical protein
MKEIKFDGVEVKGVVTGNILGGDDITIAKISSRGMLLETTAKMNINKRYIFRLFHNDKKIVIAAKVLSVLIQKAVEKGSKMLSMSHIAVEFENIGEDEKTFLNTLIDSILEHEVPNLDNLKTEIDSSKFRAQD